jgi:2,3-dimethylmalate lyase
MRLRKTVVHTKPSVELRRLFAEGNFPVRCVSGANAHHAQLAEAAGSRAFVISGSAVSANMLGLPDVGLLTLSEVVENARRVCASVSIPVIVDCDTGYGNALGVFRTVHEIVSAGAAGLFIEDQTSPKRCGFTEGKHVIEIEEMVGKLRAAMDARDSLDRNVVLMARTDARGVVGGTFEDVLVRCRAYLETGVDSLMVVGLQSREEIKALKSEFAEIPLVLLTHNLRPRLATEEYAELGIALEISKMTVIGSIHMYDYVKDFLARGSVTYTEAMEDYEAHPLSDFGFLQLSGMEAAVELEKRYVPPTA